MSHQPAIFDCLKKDLDVSGKLFLEASAGTGKTFAIEHLVARLIYEKKVPLERILIVTFTNASTRDLKKRIFKNLKALKLTLPDYLDPCEEGNFQIEKSLCHIDRAEIYTIHAFCFSMLKTFAKEAECFFDLDQTEMLTESKTATQVAIDLLRKAPFSTAELTSLFKPYDKNLNKFLRALTPLVESTDTIPPPPTPDQAIDQINEILPQLSPLNLHETIESYGLLYKGVCAKDKTLHPHFAEPLEIWQQALNKQEITKSQLDELLLLKNPFEKLHPDNLKKGKESPEDPTIDLFIHTLAPWVETIKDPRNLLLRFALSAREELEKVTREKDLPHPDTILQKAIESLDKTPFVQAVRKSYDAVIVDEFQDTDKGQWEIFRSLFLDHHPHPLLFTVVGDPKQSIYGFRGADLDMYLQAKETLGADAHYHLGTNYRSSPLLTQSLNTLFSQERLPSLFTLDPHDTSLSYIQVESGKPPLPQSGEKKSVHFLLGEAEKGRGSTWPSEGIETQQIFPAICSEIDQIIENEQGRYADICILIKDRFQAGRLQRYLKQYGYPFTSQAGESLIETKAYSLFEQWLQAIRSPRDFSKLKLLFSHPLFACDFDLLEKDIDSADIQALISSVFTMKKSLTQEGLCFAIDQLKDHLTFETIEDHSDFWQTAELLCQIESEEGQDLAAIIDTLTHLKTLSGNETKELKRRPLSEGNEIQIMTTHASKGLEFDYLFALGTSTSSNSAQKLIRLKREEAKEIILFDPTADDSKKALQALDQEKMRLFYVALTRAKKRVYIPAIFDTTQTPVPLGNSSAIQLYLARLATSPNAPSWEETYAQMETLTLAHTTTLLNQLTPFDSSFSITTNARPPQIKQPKPLSLIPLPRVTVPTQHIQVHSFTSLARLQKSPPPPLREVREEIPYTIPKGSQTGTLVHLLFEKAIETGLYVTSDFTQFVQENLFATPLEAYCNEIQAILENAFAYPLPDQFALRDVPPSQMMQEMEFLYAKQPHSFRKGFCDLFFTYNNKYYLIDWKMNLLSDYSQEGMKNAMEAQNYTLQAQIYKEAALCYLDGEVERFGGCYYFFLRGLDAKQAHGVYKEI
ncbi:MAG: RecBCD enzyme subunit RecB [Chlamydiia bacterium]|nr:RecBCD enzyme subunit RecB [Chlamydiia bacterium]